MTAVAVRSIIVRGSKKVAPRTTTNKSNKRQKKKVSSACPLVLGPFAPVVRPSYSVSLPVAGVTV